jgi:hypothetical protein
MFYILDFIRVNPLNPRLRAEALRRASASSAFKDFDSDSIRLNRVQGL